MPALAEAGQFVELGVHPSAQYQSTAYGRRLATLYGFNNKIYAGYGDYSSNTGPIAIQPYDLATMQFTPTPLLTSNTEAIYLFREIDGVLYAPHIDSKWGASGSYAYGIANGAVDTWADAPAMTSGVALHVFDIVKFNAALYLASTDNLDAAIYKSIDNGATWTVDHRVVPTASGDFLRFYGLVDFKDSLWAQADSYYGPLTTQSEVYDGTAWTTGDPMISSGTNHALIAQPEVFDRVVIFKLGHPGSLGPLFSFTGSRTSWLYPGDSRSILDFKVEGSTLWVLSSDHRILSTERLNKWTHVQTAPEGACSVLHYQDSLYVGTTDSRLLVYDPDAVPDTGPDFDADGDVDLSDFTTFQGCFNGPNRPPVLADECGGPDLDDDSDVDLADFSLFAACFNGPNRSPACE